jgi:hypothetical protein
MQAARALIVGQEIPSGSAQIRIVGALRVSDVVAGYFLGSVRPFGALLLACFGLAVVTLKDPFGYFILAVCLGLIFVYFPWSARRTFKQNKAVAETTSWEVRENGLYYKSTSHQGLIPWNHIRKWLFNRKLLLLYPATNIAYHIPSHFFASKAEYQSFIAFIRERVGRPGKTR